MAKHELRSGMLLSVEREDTPGRGDFVPRPLRTTLYPEGGQPQNYANPYYVLLDRAGPRIAVVSSLTDYLRREYESMGMFTAVVDVDAPWNGENFLISMLEEERLLDLTHRGQRLSISYEAILPMPGKSIYELGFGANDKMVRAVLQRRTK